MTTTNETRRQVMLMAWSLKREGRQLLDGRSFSQCLTWAWREIKLQAAKAAFAVMRKVRFSRSLIQSPMQRATQLDRRPRLSDFKAAYTTAMVGA